jgi:cell volume regulation protein A
MIEPLSILAFFGVTIVLGYIGTFIFERTRIPDVVWLLLFGLLVGPVLNFLNRDIFMTASPLLGAIALLIILFDAGLHMDIFQILNKISRGVLLVFLGIFLSIGGVTLVSVVFFGFGFIESLILGAIISGTSSAVVISIVDPLKIRDGVKTVLKLESIITDPIVIVLTMALIQIATATAEPFSLANSLASMYSVAIVAGLLIGVIWLLVLDKIKKREFDYMLTLAIVFLLYVGTEAIGGSGAIAALMFGLVLGNSYAFSKMLKFRKRYRVDKTLKRFHGEITFFIRSFFFVYLGLIATFNLTYLYYGLVFLVVLIIMRLAAVQISTYKMNITKVEINVMRSMMSRGLAAAVLAQMPLIYGINNADIFSNVVFIIILLTVLFTTIFVRIFYRPTFETGEVRELRKKRRKRKV